LKICDKCKKPEQILHHLDIYEGWNYREHKWNIKEVEICTECKRHFQIMMNNALCEAEKKVHEEFLKGVKEGVYESLR
jgi:hypothetical protein